MDQRRSRQQESLPVSVGLGEDVMAVIEIVELLRQLESVFGGEGRLGRRNALFDDERSLTGQQP